jgi:hypothetical protein
VSERVGGVRERGASDGLEGQGKGYESGWTKHYFDPMIAHFSAAAPAAKTAARKTAARKAAAKKAAKKPARRGAKKAPSVPPPAGA